MGIIESWNIFEKTGSITDYLNYTSCTKEETELEIYKNSREDRENGGITGDTSWNGFVGDAGRGN